MPRRNRKSPAEGFIDLASRLPWWLCLALGVLSYYTLHTFAVSPPPAIQSTRDVGNALIPILLRSAAMVGQYALPMLFTVGAILSGIRTLRQRRAAGLSAINGQQPGNSTFSATPICPKCNAPMAQRRARRGNNVGETFWGCTHYPGCKGTRPLI